MAHYVCVFFNNQPRTHYLIFYVWNLRTCLCRIDKLIKIKNIEINQSLKNVYLANCPPKTIRHLIKNKYLIDLGLKFLGEIRFKAFRVHVRIVRP